ncbi:uncharacterized protein OCT59_029162 [Rhizophagus irregularis]|uniref:uncharacterized protein n=1 Tax=Rhizophagus irregularis TaxID=588596 RepID=UPI003318F5BA|nr:hypothetical protein OCT59_029162 [Rhizophagus irregularis]
MSKQFFPNLSQNYIEILEDDEYYDITIEVGEDPNVKIFRSHMIILRYRSPFLRRTLSSNKKSDDSDLTHIKLSNISPETFQIILKYIYGGIISFNEQEPSEILRILIAADQLHLQELVDYLQEYLIKNKHQLYEELLNSYLNPNSKPNDNILLPRNRIINGIIDLKIVNLNIVSLISRWIDKIDIKSNYTYTRELYLPYEFKLLLRGSRDGFTPKKFHELCNDKLYTVTFIKIKETEEIIGGYNPLKWESHNSGKWGEAKDSFIFSFKSKNNFKDPILSYVKQINRALYYSNKFGPTFGDDIELFINEDNELKEYDRCRCVHKHYEKKIRDTGDFFSIEDYEVFQILNRND